MGPREKSEVIEKQEAIGFHLCCRVFPHYENDIPSLFILITLIVVLFDLQHKKKSKIHIFLKCARKLLWPLLTLDSLVATR